MDKKIETPIEFSVRCWPMQASRLSQEVDARDALLRADERQKAAERGVKYVDALDIGTAVDLDQLCAAIMSEPEEARR